MGPRSDPFLFQVWVPCMDTNEIVESANSGLGQQGHALYLCLGPGSSPLFVPWTCVVNFNSLCNDFHASQTKRPMAQRKVPKSQYCDLKDSGCGFKSCCQQQKPKGQGSLTADQTMSPWSRSRAQANPFFCTAATT